VETADLRESSRAAFTMLLRQLRGTPTSEEDLRITRELGVRRASQGVESEKLTAAIHRDFSVLWAYPRSLLRRGDRHRPGTVTERAIAVGEVGHRRVPVVDIHRTGGAG